MQSDILIVLITLLFSAFFSGSEIAYVSTNRLRIEIKGKGQGLISRLLAVFIRKPSHFITTMLVGNNIALVIYGIFFARIVYGLWETNQWYGFDQPLLTFLIQTIVASIVVLVVAEFVPKALASLSPFNVLTVAAIPLAFFYYLFYYIVLGVVSAAGLLLNLFSKSKIELEEQAYDRVDLFHMIDETEDNQGGQRQEGEVNTEIFKNALEFHHTRVRDCMIPRPEVDAIEINAEIDELRSAFLETGRSKIVVYRDNIDNIQGYVHSIDLYSSPTSIKSIIIPVPIATESTPASEMLKELIDKRRSIAQVVDEFGGTAGIVTVEDLMEEIFGEIDDEYDSDDLVEKQTGPREFRFSARLEIDHVNQKYGLELPEGEYDTIGGLVLHEFERIPETDELLSLNHYTIKVLSLDGARIEEVLIRVDE